MSKYILTATHPDGDTTTFTVQAESLAGARDQANLETPWQIVELYSLSPACYETDRIADERAELNLAEVDEE